MALLLVIALSFTGPGSAQDSGICVHLLGGLASPRALASGQRARIEFAGSSRVPREVIFLGAWKEQSTGLTKYFFLNPVDGKQLSVGPDSISRIERAADGRSFTPDHIQPLLVRWQGTEEPSCAALATFNGLVYLNVLGRAPDRVHNLLQTDSHSFLKTLLESPVNRPVHEMAFPGLLKLIAPSQTQIRLGILAGLGVEARIARSPAELREHLKGGLPAILDLDTVYGEEEIIELGADGSERKIERPAARPFASASSKREAYPHSVVAIRLLEQGTLGGKVVVLDSAFGTLTLWDWNQLERTSGEATLLGTSDKKGTDREDPWHGNWTNLGRIIRHLIFRPGGR